MKVEVKVSDSRERHQGSIFRFALCKLRSEFWLIGLQNCKSYENCEAVFLQGKFNLATFIFPRYIHILFIHCILSSIEISLITKLHHKMRKLLSNSLKKSRLPQAKSLATLDVFNAKWISNNNSNTGHVYLTDVASQRRSNCDEL